MSGHEPRVPSGDRRDRRDRRAPRPDRGGGRPPRAPHSPRPREDRRALTHVGGHVDLGGSPEEAELLARALDVPPPPRPAWTPGGERDANVPEPQGEGADRAHVHGFHAYPARMHPDTASRLIASFIPEGGTVLDPFCGSGTVLVEAMLLGRDAVGTDLNPLATALSTLKTRARDEAALARLVEAAREVAALADTRRKAKAGATRRYPPVDTEAFDPHVLLELDSLRHGIRALEEKGSDPATAAALRDDLMLVLSAILVKVSRKESDTSGADKPKRLAAGYAARLFAKKTEELAGRLRELEARMPSPRPQATVALADATDLRALATASVDGVVTSPPYVATYDYLAHHALRLRWLGLDSRAFEAKELGSRRAYADLTPHVAWDRWANELHALLGTLARVTRPGGAVVLLMADSAVQDQPIPADEIVAEVASKTPLECVARASQVRPHFHKATRGAFRERPRAEHALLLRRT